MFSSIEKQIGVFILAVLGVVFGFSLVYLYVAYLPLDQPAAVTAEEVVEAQEENVVEEQRHIVEQVVWEEDLNQSVLLNVPFTSQAPYAHWNNDMYQYGCEEASLLMAMHWVQRDDSLTVDKAQREIALISQFEQKRTGSFYDTSAEDTAQLMRDYYGYQNVDVRTGIGVDDIKRELLRGNLVIVPVNGKVVRNPYFTSAPLAHMFVIVGYDAASKEFIINDPGTSRGEGLRHEEEVIEAGLQDYPTGHSEPIMVVNKVMIVVKPFVSEMVIYNPSNSDI